MTAKLIMTLDGVILKEIGVTRDSLSIGRRTGNDIQINDMTVSSRHALLTTIGNDTFIEDLGATNGTMVNGNYINKLLLMHGDIVQIGTHQFTYFAEEEAEYEPTMFIKAEMDETRIMPNTPPITSDMKGIPLGAARLLNGPSANIIMEMRKPFNTIGYKGVSMAIVTRGLNGYTIAAYRGKNGQVLHHVTMLNGENIDFVARQLCEHDIIDVAGFQMEFIYLH